MPSLRSVGTVALACVGSAAAKQWYLRDSYDASNFFDKFNFVDAASQDGGYVHYQSKKDAFDLGLVSYEGEEVYMGVDHRTLLQGEGAAGRPSVRIESKAEYNHGLFIARFTHLPQNTCGTWPSFFTFGSPAPTAGEIDIYRSGKGGLNQPALITGESQQLGTCKLDGEGQTSPVTSNNCDISSPNKGCASADHDGPFASTDGGVYAIEWTTDFIKLYSWTWNNAPADVNSEEPNTDSWGAPSVWLKNKNCDIDDHFVNQKIALSIDLCSQTWDDSCKASTGAQTCVEYAAKNPSAFSEAFFKIQDIRYFKGVRGVKTAPAAPVVTDGPDSHELKIRGAADTTTTSFLGTGSSSTFSTTGRFTNSSTTATGTKTDTNTNTKTDSTTNTGTKTDTQTGSTTATGSATGTKTDGTATGTKTDGTATGTKTGTETGTKTGTQTGSQTGTATGTKTDGTATGTKTDGTATGTKTGTQTGSQTGTATGTKTDGTATGTKTGTETGTKTGTQTGSQTGTKTGTDGTATGTKTGTDGTATGTKTGTDGTATGTKTGTDGTATGTKTGTDGTATGTKTGTDGTATGTATGTQTGTGTAKPTITGTDIITKTGTETVTLITSTVCTTVTETVTKCPPGVSCPAGGYVTTKTIPWYVTVCPAGSTPTPPPQTVTQTLTKVYTVTACPPEVKNCKIGQVVTKYVTTTYCPYLTATTVPHVPSKPTGNDVVIVKTVTNGFVPPPAFTPGGCVGENCPPKTTIIYKTVEQVKTLSKPAEQPPKTAEVTKPVTLNTITNTAPPAKTPVTTTTSVKCEGKNCPPPVVTAGASKMGASFAVVLGALVALMA